MVNHEQRGLAAVALTLVVLLGLTTAVGLFTTGLAAASDSPAADDVAPDAPDARKRRVFVPFVSRAVPPLPSFSDDFEAGVDNWTPYTNLKELLPEQWYWDEDGGYGGTAGYTFDHSRGGEDPEDAITLYLGEDSEEWGDYRASVRFYVHRGAKAGLWVRGTYRDQGYPGQWFLGYYCMVKVNQSGPALVQLFQLRTYEDPGDPPPWYDRNYYHFTNPYELEARKIGTPVRPKEWHNLVVEAKGGNVKCWVEDELAVEHTDTYGSIFLNGTIGLKVYGGPANPAVVSFDDVLVEPLP